ncbi:MAG: hypothetical protein LBL75_03860 [Rickettsiales bacterium]|jgi:hypothetical protein|nr:hypothetical protein [Rickettsiales bacterium]
MKTNSFTSFIIIAPLFAVSYSLFTIDADAALRTGNAGTGRGVSYSADQLGVYDAVAQQAVNDQERIASATTSEELGLQVRVADMNLARDIASGVESVLPIAEKLDKCAAIYPTGAMAWDNSNIGLRPGVDGCVADVELRYINGTDDIVLARGRLSAGDSIKCNVSSFPADSYTIDAGKIEFPADREPTMDDVEKQMNAEMHKNEGIKVITGTLLGALGGNFIGQNDPGNSAMLGTSADKMKKTAMGALLMGGATLASTNAGKVGGDVIMGATINAIGGGMMGNLSGIGGSTLVIKKCDGGDCLYGVVASDAELPSRRDGFYNKMQDTQFSCQKNGNGYTGCTRAVFSQWSLNGKTQYDKAADVAREMENVNSVYCLDGDKMTLSSSGGCGGGQIFYLLSGVRVSNQPQPAVIKEWKSDVNTSDEFNELKRKGGTYQIYGRYNDGTIGDELSSFSIQNFTPVVQTASNGDGLDFNNSARTGATITGAGIGAGLGALGAYKGATTEMDNRWVSAVQTYKDSLTKFYCGTGRRYLSSYNEITIIPNMTE